MIASGTPAFWRATLALCFGSVIVFSNLYITQPRLPLLQQSFALTPPQAGATLSVTTLTLGMFLVLFGPVSGTRFVSGSRRTAVRGSPEAIRVEWHQQQVVEAGIFTLPKTLQAQLHGLMVPERALTGGAEEIVEPGECAGEIAVGVSPGTGVVQPVEIGSHDKQAETLLHVWRNTDVAVAQQVLDNAGGLVHENDFGGSAK